MPYRWCWRDSISDNTVVECTGPQEKITLKLVRSKNYINNLRTTTMFRGKMQHWYLYSSVKQTVSGWLYPWTYVLSSYSLRRSISPVWWLKGAALEPYSCGVIYAPIFRTILDSRSPTFEKYIVRSIVFGATYLLTTFKMARQRFLFINCLCINKPSPESI